MSNPEPETVNEPTTDAMTITNEKFWTNEVVWKEITSYLRISDLKALSVVNKQFLDKIRRNPRIIFKQILKGKLKVRPPVLNKAIVEVNRVNEKYLEKFGAGVFENVTHLELQRLGKISNKIRVRILKKIICNCKMLKSLGFSPQNFFYEDYQELFSDEEVKQILSQLEELYIGIQDISYRYENSDDDGHGGTELSQTGPSTMYSNYNSDNELVRHGNSNSDKKVDPHEIFKLFPDINFKLKKFSYYERNGRETATHFYPELILKSSFNCLVDIDLCFHISGLEQLSSIEDSIPNLKNLQIQIFGDQIRNGPVLFAYDQLITDHLVPFIKRYSQTLQIFALHGHEKFSLPPICETLKSLKKIRSISLKNESSFNNTIQSVNLSFLQALSTLRSFEMQIKMNGSEALEYFTEDQIDSDDEDEHFITIRRSSYSDGWLRYLMALPTTITSIDLTCFEEKEQPLSLQVTGTLERFQNLTKLSMIECLYFLYDDTLQCICTHLTKLKIFSAEFDKITDFGISGCRPDGSESGVSLKNLTGLNVLYMGSYAADYRESRWKITWDGFLKSVQFLELYQLLTYGVFKDVKDDGEKSDSKDGKNYLKLINQNPSLEKCVLDFYTPGHRFRRAARKHPRLKLHPL